MEITIKLKANNEIELKDLLEDAYKRLVSGDCEYMTSTLFNNRLEPKGTVSIDEV
jgi:hypothetical protein